MGSQDSGSVGLATFGGGTYMRSDTARDRRWRLGRRRCLIQHGADCTRGGPSRGRTNMAEPKSPRLNRPAAEPRKSLAAERTPATRRQPDVLVVEEEIVILPGEQGDRGPKGPVGLPGERGERGDKGAKGEAGLRGERGDKGAKGEAGLRGERGDKGAKGEPGLA